MVVLINGGTASAAELVAGALQDHDRAVIVGRPSFGKALMMKPIRLTDGSVLMLVVGHVRTPCGRVIQRSYRGLDLRDYYHQAAAVRDTTGLPSCRTDAGRTVYGGGGIFPDIALGAKSPTPVWFDRLQVDNIPLQWVGGYLDSTWCGVRHSRQPGRDTGDPRLCDRGLPRVRRRARRLDSNGGRRRSRPPAAAHLVGRFGQVGTTRVLPGRYHWRP